MLGRRSLDALHPVGVRKHQGREGLLPPAQPRVVPVRTGGFRSRHERDVPGRDAARLARASSSASGSRSIPMSSTTGRVEKTPRVPGSTERAVDEDSPMFQRREEGLGDLFCEYAVPPEPRRPRPRAHLAILNRQSPGSRRRPCRAIRPPTHRRERGRRGPAKPLRASRSASLRSSRCSAFITLATSHLLLGRPTCFVAIVETIASSKNSFLRRARSIRPSPRGRRRADPVPIARRGRAHRPRQRPCRYRPAPASASGTDTRPCRSTSSVKALAAKVRTTFPFVLTAPRAGSAAWPRTPASRRPTTSRCTRPARW